MFHLSLFTVAQTAQPQVAVSEAVNCRDPVSTTVTVINMPNLSKRTYACCLKTPP